MKPSAEAQFHQQWRCKEEPRTTYGKAWATGSSSRSSSGGSLDLTDVLTDAVMSLSLRHLHSLSLCLV